MATKVKWYQIVAEKIRVSVSSNMRPDAESRKTAARRASPAFSAGRSWVGESGLMRFHPVRGDQA
jgi:hypothetical protein